MIRSIVAFPSFPITILVDVIEIFGKPLERFNFGIKDIGKIFNHEKGGWIEK